ncbi:MAG: B12-binding domain-containing protein, partial [Candidatus Aminicenantes bacterium]|nr:B12-binding domain-containing protein [Candidatus Aminicenantes bacterium]
MDTINSISTQLISGNDKDVASDTKKALDEGISAETILNDGLIKG